MKLDELRRILEQHGRLTLVYIDPVTKQWVFYKGEVSGSRIFEYDNYINLGGAAVPLVKEAEAAKALFTAEKLREGNSGSGRSGRGG